MPTRYSMFDFEMELATTKGEDLPVTVEATISRYGSNVEIEGVKVCKRDTNIELVLSDKQMSDVYEEIWERVDD